MGFASRVWARDHLAHDVGERQPCRRASTFVLSSQSLSLSPLRCIGNGARLGDDGRLATAERRSVDTNRLFGGNPLGVIVRLVVLSIVVGIVMSALDIRPENIIYHVRLLIERISRLGFGIFETAIGYFLLGAAVVIPIWLVVRLLGALGGRSDRRN